VISAESIGHVVSAVMQGWSAPKLESPLDSASRPRAKPR
jgi:hypothetical protein